MSYIVICISKSVNKYAVEINHNRLIVNTRGKVDICVTNILYNHLKMETSTNLYTVECVTQSQISDILSFLYENFDKDETMLKSLRDNSRITQEDEKLMRLDHERLLRTILTTSPCLVALENLSKKIIGVSLMIVSNYSRPSTNNDAILEVLNNNPPTTKIMKIYFDYLSEISDKANLYGKFANVKQAMEFYAVAVDKNYRRRGIAKSLMAAGISFAKTGNIELVFGVYTSRYSKRVAEKFGFKSVMDVDLLNYKDKNGYPIFQDTPPHNIVSVMVLEIA